MRLSRWKESCYPNLGSAEYRVTSQQTSLYNCIAYAAGSNDVWWWPDSQSEYYWPHGIDRTETVEAFVAAYGTLGYEIAFDASKENGFEKIALYVDELGIPSHAARQLTNGKWTSKLGAWEDIEHDTPEALAGKSPAYGRVAQILRRKRTT